MQMCLLLEAIRFGIPFLIMAGIRPFSCNLAKGTKYRMPQVSVCQAFLLRIERICKGGFLRSAKYL